MQINKENLTIVILTIKSEAVVYKCLDSIHPEIKKIIVENSSDKKVFDKLKASYQNIECYSTGENFGMGKGNNIGIKKCKTKYVMILNPDTILEKDALDKIFKISKGLDFAILSPINDNEKYPNYKIGKKRETTNEDLIEVDYVDGYSMILNIDKFDGNYFDEKIFMYLENDDLCLRTKKNKEKIYVYKKSFIKHLGAQAVNKKFAKELELSRNWHWSWSKFYYRKKHYGFTFAFINGFPGFIFSCLKFSLYYLLKDKYRFKIYFNRATGFYNSLINKSSWYRPALD
jgi:GT2 family glycosyltransferase